MLLVWPLVSVLLWQRLSPQRALVWTILGGYLVLPPLTSFDLPVVPNLDKMSIPNLMALFCAVFVLKDRISFLPQSWAGRLLIALYLTAPIATVMTNLDPLWFANIMVPGMRIYDSIASIAYQAIALIPFFLGRKYLATADGARALLLILISAGLVYSVPIIIESLVSPMMNIWVYGFFQHDFFQTLRQGGYRPVVFLPHGLWVAFFSLMTVFAAMIIGRQANNADRPKALLVGLYLFFILTVCKSAGPMIYLFLIGPVILLLPSRVHLMVAGALAVVVLLYPLLRSIHAIPVDQILDVAHAVSAERGGSLAFRIYNEEFLLSRAAERPWFGWGGYGRGFLHNPETGEISTIADGWWVIVLGNSGWFGYIGEFGLTALSLLLLARRTILERTFVPNPYHAGIALILAANMVDFLPNATSIPFTWLMAGALLGYVEQENHDLRAKARIEKLIRLPKRTII